LYFFSYGGNSAVLPGAARLVSLQLPPRMIGFTATHWKRWEPKRGRRSLRPRALAAHRLWPQAMLELHTSTQPHG